MRKSIEDDLKAIGLGLDAGILPTVFNRGVIRPDSSSVVLKPSGQEAAEQVATPANWNQGEDVIIVPAVNDEAAAEKYPNGWDAPLPYLRYVKQP